MKNITLILCAFVFSMFLGISDLLANEIGNELKSSVSINPNIENIKSQNNKNDSLSKSSGEDIFGDEQAFPFVAGLGKNAAHWININLDNQWKVLEL